MRPHAPLLCWMTVAAVATLPAAASGQSIPSPYRFIEKGQEISLFAGVIGTNTGQFGFGPRSAAAFGIRYGVEISGPLGLEVVTTLIPTERDVVNPSLGEGSRVVGDPAESFLVFLDAR
ncbi:MAG: hypothetical protein RQ751_12490, partial [Longimicrobiales bacterium]|nr:hypothetical protein [Longimicrobiales bacterium]